MILAVFSATFEQERPERDSNPDLCDAAAVLYQSSYQANWELVFIWVHDKPVDDGYRMKYYQYKIHT